MLWNSAKTKSLQLWDMDTGAPIGKPLVHQDTIVDLAFSTDGKQVATSSSDQVVKLWDVHTGELLFPLASRPKGRTLALHPDGKVLLAAAERKLHFWKCPSGEPLHEPWSTATKINYALYNHAGDRIAIVFLGGEVQIRAAEQGTILFTMPGGGAASISSVAFAPDDSVVVLSDWEGTVWVWRLTGPQPESTRLEHHEPVFAALISPDGKLVVTASSAGIVRIWDIKTGQLVGTPLQGLFVNDLAFSPDSRMITVGRELELRIIDAATCSPLGPAAFSPRPVEHVGFSADGRIYQCADNHRTANRFASPLPYHGTLEEIRTRIQVRTGLALDRDGLIKVLDHRQWTELRRHCKQ